MSLYNMVFGVERLAPALLVALRLDPSDVPRFRDCYLTSEFIVVHTRTGGGNRDYYESEGSCRRHYPEYFKEGEEHPTGPWNEDLRANPHYSHDEDSEYDTTYADFYFRFPKEYAEDLAALAAVKVTATPSEKWATLMASLRGETK